MKKIGNIIFYTIASLIFMMFIMEVFIPYRSIELIGFKGYVVPTPSMKPVISPGDLIFVGKADLDNLEAEDIITFYADINFDGRNETVTHAIRSIEYEAGVRVFKTYGINNTADDTYYITDDDVIGSYLFRIPWLGFPIIFFKILMSNPIMLGLILINVTIFIVLIKVLKKKPKED